LSASSQFLFLIEAWLAADVNIITQKGRLMQVASAF